MKVRAAAQPALLQTKLRMPRLRPRHVPRVRLLTALDAGLEARLVLVSAPAGFGNTTLLTDWLASRSIPAGWVSLDVRDNDAARFLRYVVAAARPLLADSPSPDGVRCPAVQAEAAEAEVANLLAATPGDAVLVLDDYHTITAPAVHAAVAFLLEHLPAQIHLVIAKSGRPAAANCPLPGPWRFHGLVWISRPSGTPACTHASLSTVACGRTGCRIHCT
jgi:LuxR family transcriptional regulator, maltose regulon positive regulatory protein